MHNERKLPGMYDVNILGFNYRMNELQAAIGSTQIDRLDDFLSERKKNHDILTEKILKKLMKYTNSKPQMVIFKVVTIAKALYWGGLEKKRVQIIEYLKRKGVGTSIYYPKPVPELTYYKNKYGYEDGQFPEARKIANHSIALPVGPLKTR